jgi:hypothetical protein
VKRKNMAKSDKEARYYYKSIFRVRKKIDPLFSAVDNFGLKFVMAMNRKGLTVKVILLTSNIFQLMR